MNTEMRTVRLVYLSSGDTRLYFLYRYPNGIVEITDETGRNHVWTENGYWVYYGKPIPFHGRVLILGETSSISVIDALSVFNSFL